MAQAITVTDIRKNFGAVEALKGVSLDVADGEKVVVIGPSGSGKSVLIRCINGLEVPDSGTVVVEGMNLSDRKVNARALARDVAMVFQSYNLYPHKTVLENVTLAPIKVLKVPREQAERDGRAYLERVGLSDKVDKYPDQLSGGQQQRVAIARALVNHPKVLLLDEPLGALDLKLRKDMQIELKKIQQQVGITFIYVTHDQEEALTMSDTIVVMDKGNIQQIGSPTDIYNEPKNAFVADFIGESNIIDGIMHADGVVGMYGKKFSCVDSGFQKDEPVDVVIRPEDIDIVPEEEGQLTGTVTEVTFKGVHYDIIVDFRGFKWLIQTTDFSPVGAKIGVKIDPDGFHIMKKSAYSGKFGDYSSYSDEYDELSEDAEDADEE